MDGTGMPCLPFGVSSFASSDHGCVPMQIRLGDQAIAFSEADGRLRD
jgi:hypothetical protein